MTEDNIARFPDLGSEPTREIIRCAIEVHRELGPGLLESVYESCLALELKRAGMNVEQQVAIPVVYKGIAIEQIFRLDLRVNGKIVLEIKACEKILPIHEAQLITYLKLSRSPIGLLVNFNEKLLKNGIKRLVRAEFAS